MKKEYQTEAPVDPAMPSDDIRMPDTVAADATSAKETANATDQSENLPATGQSNSVASSTHSAIAEPEFKRLRPHEFKSPPPYGQNRLPNGIDLVGCSFW